MITITNAQPTFVSNHTRASWAQTLLLLNAGLAVLGIAASYWQIALLSEISTRPAAALANEAQLEASDVILGTIGVLQIIAYIVSVVLFCMWIHRAHSNLLAFGARNLKLSATFAFLVVRAIQVRQDEKARVQRYLYG